MSNPAPKDDSPGFLCHLCGEYHADLPLDVGYDEPMYVAMLSPEWRAERVTAHGDLRVVRHPDGHTDYFVRGLIEIPIENRDDVFCYGVWVSLIAASYEAAATAERLDEPAGPFFGWLSNSLPGYPETINLKTEVCLHPGRRAPVLLEPTEHPLAVEQREGISAARHREIVIPLLHPRTS